MIGFIALLKNNQLDEKSTKYLDIIDETTHNLDNIINEILDYSKITSPQFKLDNGIFNLNHSVSNILEKFTAVASTNNIIYKFKTVNLPELVKGDPIYLTKVMEIIVNNAIKFTIDKGTVIIKATYDSSSQIFRFAVKDSGIGMSDEQVKIIFQPFTQVDGSFTRKYGGLGLGLTIVNNLVKLMSGTIHVDSQKNVGSIFIIEVPFQIANKENNNEY